ncbi:RNA-binding protein [Yersinia phage vB_YenM_P778]
MSRLFETSKMHNTHTENGAVVHESSLSSVVDFYTLAGSSRNHVQNALSAFNKALVQDKDLAVRITLHARDIRAGMGERNVFRTILASLLSSNKFTQDEVVRILKKVPEMGRWDDMLVAFNTPYENIMFDMFISALTNDKTAALAAKWLPRRRNGKNKLFVHKFCKHAAITRQQYQKVLADLSRTVEQQICAKEFSAIDYNKIPSVAASRYQKLFEKHDQVRYGMWIEALSKPVEERAAGVKVNAGALYPYDVIRSLNSVNDARVAQAQWDALPDFMSGSTENILCMSDVSGSMTGEVFGNVDALDIGVSLSMYCAERNQGVFKDKVMIYSTNPFFIDLSGGVRERRNQMMKHVEYGSTNFAAAFDKILELAKRHNLAQEDLPTKVLVFSDMQFDSIGGRQTNFEAIVQKFERAGYVAPTLVFWYLASRKPTSEATIRDKNVALVSGFSPAILKAVLGGDSFNPLDIVKKAVCIERYDW